MAAHVAGGVWFGNERGLEERSRKPFDAFRAEPFDPFGNGLRRGLVQARDRQPCSTRRQRPPAPLTLDLWASEAHSYGCSSGPPEKLKLRNLSFLGQDRMDNLLKAHI